MWCFGWGGLLFFNFKETNARIILLYRNLFLLKSIILCLHLGIGGQPCICFSVSGLPYGTFIHLVFFAHQVNLPSAAGNS